MPDSDREAVSVDREEMRRSSPVRSQEDKSSQPDGDGTAGFAKLVMCFVGLQLSYLTWGVLQEKVMTNQYRGGKFPSAMFCVLMNRLFAVATALALVLLSRNRRPFSHADLLRCAPAALSNTASSFGQYQALRYISFPLQTITKSTKVTAKQSAGSEGAWCS